MADIPQSTVDQLNTDVAKIHDVLHSTADTVQTDNGPIRTFTKFFADMTALVNGLIPDLSNKQDTAAKNNSDGYVGLSGYKAVIKNAAGTFQTLLASLATANRDISLPDADGTIALTSDVAAITALIGAADGIVPLDANSKIAAIYLPAYVDDVIEGANLAAFPATGETGKIYVALDSNMSYRWSGSTYVEIVASPGTTDAVVEGANNKYFNEGRVLATVLAGFSTASAAAVTVADSVLSALGKLQAQITAALAFAKTYDFHAFVSGKPAANATVFLTKAVRAFTLPQSATGSVLFSEAASQAASTFTIYKNGVSIGTMQFGAAATVGTFTVNSAVSFAVGDVLKVTSPATQDGTLSGVAFSLKISQD